VSVDGGVAPEQALSPDNAGFNRLARLHDRKQRNHATQRKVDETTCSALLLEHVIRPKLDRAKPRLDAFEFVSRKLPQNAVSLRCVVIAHARLRCPFGGAETAAWEPDAPNSACCGGIWLRGVRLFAVLFKRGSSDR
jgi:hypothetical protein